MFRGATPKHSNSPMFGGGTPKHEVYVKNKIFLKLT